MSVIAQRSCPTTIGSQPIGNADKDGSVQVPTLNDTPWRRYRGSPRRRHRRRPHNLSGFVVLVTLSLFVSNPANGGGRFMRRLESCRKSLRWLMTSRHLRQVISLRTRDRKSRKEKIFSRASSVNESISMSFTPIDLGSPSNQLTIADTEQGSLLGY